MGQTFDELSKALAKGVSRRQALKGIFASLVGTIAGAAFAERAAFADNVPPATCTNFKKHCFHKGYCCVECSGAAYCTPDANGVPCPPGSAVYCPS
jgi:hypothetical protein